MCKWRKDLKRKIWEDSYFCPDRVPCRYCRTPLSFDEATLEHLIPVCKGGSRGGLWNLDISCLKCNNEKGDTILEQDLQEVEAAMARHRVMEKEMEEAVESLLCFA